MKRRMARQWINRWKINKALDAYRDFLGEQQRNGAFEIIDKVYEAPFWRTFTDDAMHVFYDKDDGARFISTPWRPMETPPGK